MGRRRLRRQALLGGWGGPRVVNNVVINNTTIVNVWYQQRADACADPQLKDVLLHNKNEEIEHATMVLEWIRRHNQQFDQMLRKYLFTETPITALEKGAETNGRPLRSDDDPRPRQHKKGKSARGPPQAHACTDHPRSLETDRRRSQTGAHSSIWQDASR